MSWFAKIIKSIVDFVKNLSNSNGDTVNSVDPTSTEPTTTETTTSGADEIPFADLVWSYGGFKGAGSVVNPDAVIKKSYI